MKDLRIPILFAFAAIVFSMVSLLSCQSEDVASAEESSANVEMFDEATMDEANNNQKAVEYAEAREVEMRFGPR